MAQLASRVVGLMLVGIASAVSCGVPDYSFNGGSGNKEGGPDVTNQTDADATSDVGAPDAGPDADAAPDAPVDAFVDADADAAPATLPFFVMMRSTADDAGAEAAPAMVVQPAVVDLVQPDAGSRPIACPRSGDFAYFARTPPAGGGSCGNQNGPYLNGMLAIRGYYSNTPMVAPGSSRFAYLDVVANVDAGEAGVITDYPLYVADELSDCASRRARRIDYKGPFAPGARHVLPRFSPDGSRVAYFDITGSGCNGLRVRRLVTVGVDGSSPRILRDASDLAKVASLWLAPPRWLDASHVAWVEVDQVSCTSCSGDSHVMEIADKDQPLPSDLQELLKCARSSLYGIEQIEPFVHGPKSRVALVANSGPWIFGQGPSDIYVGDLGAPCGNLTNLTNGSPGSMSRDLAVSPDGSLFAFASNRPDLDAGADADAAPPQATSPMHVWLMSSLGSTPQPCSGLDPATDDVGPQWIEAGKKLAWTRLPHGSSSAGAIMFTDVVNGVCTNPRPLLDDPPGAAEAGTSPTYIASSNASVFCGTAMGRPSNGAPAVLLAFLALAGIVRRRERRACA